jgi:hypothetical protein
VLGQDLPEQRQHVDLAHACVGPGLAVQSRDLGCVHERLGLGVGGREAGKSPSESIRYPVGETV